jgi:hypothetical protein
MNLPRELMTAEAEFNLSTAGLGDSHSAKSHKRAREQHCCWFFSAVTRALTQITSHDPKNRCFFLSRADFGEAVE